jgi:hypothetical protein
MQHIDLHGLPIGVVDRSAFGPQGGHRAGKGHASKGRQREEQAEHAAGVLRCFGDPLGRRQLEACVGAGDGKRGLRGHVGHRQNKCARTDIGDARGDRIAGIDAKLIDGTGWIQFVESVIAGQTEGDRAIGAELLHGVVVQSVKSDPSRTLGQRRSGFGRFGHGGHVPTSAHVGCHARLRRGPAQFLHGVTGPVLSGKSARRGKRLARRQE